MIVFPPVGRVLDFAEKLWNGEAAFTGDAHPLAVFLGLEELAEGVAFVSNFSNVVALDTPEGLVLVDTGAFVFGRHVFEEIRRWSDRPVHTAIYTHGHVDHVFGIQHFDEEAKGRGLRPPRVIAHERVPDRFRRYSMSAGYNTVINARQFQVAQLQWPTGYRFPDETYHDERMLRVGGLDLHLRHDLGETDDHTWVWIPARRILCTGDLFIWAAPNCGNPQKVQRYPRQWSIALRRMMELDAEILCPGHGVPIVGRDRIRQALGDTAELLATIHDQTLELMNAGKRLDEILHAVKVPKDLLERPYLRPAYDDPAFIVRNVWRLYGGWYDGNPANLKPAPEREVAREVASVCGGPRKLAERAAALLSGGALAVASHLVELAFRADPGDPQIRSVRKAVYEARAAAEPSLMARSIFRAAARES